jgi:hypothetical protein
MHYPNYSFFEKKKHPAAKGERWPDDRIGKLICNLTQDGLSAICHYGNLRVLE